MRGSQLKGPLDRLFLLFLPSGGATSKSRFEEDEFGWFCFSWRVLLLDFDFSGIRKVNINKDSSEMDLSCFAVGFDWEEK